MRRRVAIIQARTGSTRLPGKVLADILGKPLLQRVIERVKAARTLDELVVATTTLASDDAIVELAQRLGVRSFRGSEEDVLDRFYRCGVKLLRLAPDDVIVRVTADCPLLDPTLLDQAVREFETGGYDYVSNTLVPTYPDGLDVEVLSFHTLRVAWLEATLRSDREHVTPFIWRQPDRFRLGELRSAIDLSALRWTVDEPEDLEFVRRVYALIGQDVFPADDVVALLRRFPELSKLNARFTRNEGYAKSVREDVQP